MSLWRRFSYKGTKEQLPKVEAILKESNVDRKIMYLILKYFEINPDAVEVLEKEFSDEGKMKITLLQEYLYSLLGKSESQKLEKALKTKKIVLIKGDNGTGKTTLANVLNKFGYHAVEDFEIYEITLQKPLNSMIPNMKEVIFSEQGTSEKY